MSIGIFPTLSQFFPNEKYADINEILDGCPSDFVLTITSHINSQIFVKDSFTVHEKIFKTIIFQRGILNSEEIFERFKKFKDKFSNRDLAIFPLFNVLKLIENELSHYRTIDIYSNAEKELKTLKAVLFLNEKHDEDQILKKTENTFHLLWGTALNQYEYRRAKKFDTELYLSISMFDYLKSKYPEYFYRYLEVFGCENEQVFRKNLILLFINAWNTEKGELQCLFPAELEDKNHSVKPYVRDLATHDFNSYESSNFKGLRNKPILKLNNGQYLIFNWNFIIDKFRQGLLFDFYNMSGLKADGVRFEDYKSIFGKEYSEKELFVYTLNSLYSHDESIISRWDDGNGNWNFDYYLRIENKIILFEFKDILMGDDIKQSTGETIEKYFNENFIETANGKPKGITQLINQIIEINDNPNYVENYDDYGLKKENLIIFPVIVYTDNSFSIPNLNLKLSKHFKDKLDEINYDFFIVYKPILIGMNSIINHYYLLKERPINIVKMLHSYRMNLTAYGDYFRRNPSIASFFNQSISFDDYINVSYKLSNDITETYAFKEASKRLFPGEHKIDE
jgi:hypothetical protein